LQDEWALHSASAVHSGAALLLMPAALLLLPPLLLLLLVLVPEPLPSEQPPHTSTRVSIRVNRIVAPCRLAGTARRQERS